MASVKLEVEEGKFYRDQKGCKRGPIYSVHSNDGFPWTEPVNTTYWSDEGKEEHGGACLIAEWTDAPTTPVRTVTRKELVPGLYGNVYVEKYEGQLGASMEFTADPTVIRAAIATLSEIADVLEENQ